MILKLPEGYDTVVTTTVGRISGGQIQRIGLADHQKLFDRGLAQASRVLALQRTQAELSGNLGDLVAREADAAGPITEIEIEIQSQFTRRQEEVFTRLRDQQFRALELGERAQALLDRLERMAIRAPASGIVYVALLGFKKKITFTKHTWFFKENFEKAHLIFLILIILFLSERLISQTIKYEENKDPKFIVIDEFIGQTAALVFCNQLIFDYILAC